MNTEKKKPSVYGIMKAILAKLNSPQEQKSLAGDLAAIRNSIGKRYEEAAEVWPILFPLMPEEYLGNGELSREEKALLVTLQLYAVGQQGSNKVQNNEESRNVGYSLHSVRQEDSQAMDRRFNTMLTATTFDEFVYHLRQIFKLGKAKGNFSVNYPELANDLYWYQNGRDKQVCLNWAKGYYHLDSINESDHSQISAAENHPYDDKEAAI